MPLSAGSIAIVGINADGTDNLAFVALEEVPAGTAIYFSDREWDGTAFNTGESAFSFTPTATLAVGAVVQIDRVNDTVAPTSPQGTVAFIGEFNPGFAAGGDTVYAYVGTSEAVPTAFLTAVATDGFSAANGTLTNTGLTVGATALEFTGGIDIAGYDGPRNNQQSFAAYRTILNTPGSFTTQNADGDQSVDLIAPDAPFSTAAFSLGGPSQTVRFALNSLTVAQAEGNSSPTFVTFTVERVGSTERSVAISGSVTPAASNGTNAADFVNGTNSTSFIALIAAGQTTGTFSLFIQGDTTIETTERFTLTINDTNGDGISTTIDPAQSAATGVVQNDDAGDTIGGIRVFDQAASLTGATTTPVATDAVQLVRLGSLDGFGAEPEGRAESLAFDPTSDLIFTSNLAVGRVDFARLDAAGTLTAAGGIDLTGLPQYGSVNSVAVRNGVLAVAYENATGDEAGFVALYDIEAATGAATLRGQAIQAGVLPDQVVFTPDGARLLVANEGTALSTANDPAGSVSIIDVATAAVVNTIGFGSLAGEDVVLRERGLATLRSQAAENELEPEYISISPDGTRAYVTLQEVNAVAVIDLTNPAADRPLSIQALGTIDRSLPGNAFDPNDQNGIRLINAPVSSLPQPDALASFAVGGVTYVITANEGDARENLGDSVRLGAAAYVLDPAIFPNAAELKANTALGRLNVLTNVGDTDGDGDFDQIFTLGGRGVSIFRQNADGSLERVRETGGEFEAIIAARFPSTFNINQDGTAIDNRSDDKGPEPEGIDVGVVGGRTYAFIALERTNGLMIYDVTDPANASFVGYRPGTGQDFGPEVVKVIAAADSPTGDTLVLTANEISGATTVYRLETAGAGADEVIGGDGADPLNGGAGDDYIGGGGGDDVLNGGPGSDYIRGEAGADTAQGGAGADELQGGAGDDLLGGADDRDIVSGGDGNDRLFGDGGDDFVDGGAGDDLLEGGEGADELRGASGADALIGGNGADILIAGVGRDYLRGDDGDDRLLGEAEGDELHGSAGADSLLGGEGDDVLVGEADADRLEGGAGADYLAGGEGADVFSYRAASESGAAALDVIADFESGLDKLDLSGLRTGVADVLRIDRVEGYTIVSVDQGGDGTADFAVQVNGGAIAAADILFVI